jgi:hypothetical protein
MTDLHPMPLVVTRRRVLGGALFGGGAALLGGAVSGCRAPWQDAKAAPPDPLAALIAAERGLIASYDAAITALPQLSDRLSALRADHLTHLNVLRRTVDPAAAALPGAAPTAGGPPVGTHAPKPGGDPMPTDQAGALAALATATQQAADRFGQACLTAPPRRAGLLGAIAACESSHLGLLS